MHRVLGPALACGIAVGSAAGQEPWSVSDQLSGAGDREAKDVSGIACAGSDGFPRDCLIIDDEAVAAQRARVTDGRIDAGRRIDLDPERLDDEDIELDGEAVASADGVFYVIGSHGAARRTEPGDERVARLRAGGRLFRLRPRDFGWEVDVSAALTPAILANADLRPFAGEDLESNGLTVEGLAVLGDRAFVGFRGPLLDGGTRAAVLELDLASLFGGDADAGTLHRLALGSGRGVRDLAPAGDSLLVLAGPGPDVDGTYSIFRWSPGSDAVLLGDLPAFEHDGDQDKAEAILPLRRNSDELHVLVLFDGPDEGAPRAFELPWPE